MRLFKISAAALMCAAVLSSCGSGTGSEGTTSGKSASDIVIETIMTRRSVRQYQPAAVGRDTMKTILECGINAPNGMNRQSWEIRVVSAMRPQWCSSPMIRHTTCPPSTAACSERT